MKAFAIAVVVAAVLATGVGFAFDRLNESSAEAYSTSGVRLDRLETVTNYGREPRGVQELPKG
jgi:hypothetical protein